MDTEPKTSKKEGISRRKFLRMAATVIGVTALPFSLSGDTPLKETVEKKEWSLEDVLTDPEPFIDNVVSKLKSLPKNKLTEVDENFIFTYPPAPIEKVNLNRTELIKAYKKYGAIILDYRERFKKIDVFPGRDIDTEMGYFSSIIRPWKDLINKFSDESDPSRWHVSPENLQDLNNLFSWFQGDFFDSKYKDSYYNDKAQNEVNIKSIIKKIDETWDDALKSQILGYLPEWMKHKDEAKNSFIKTLDIINKNLPFAFAEFNNEVLVTGGTGRARFEELGFDQKEVIMNIDEFISGYTKLLVDTGELDIGKIPIGLPYNPSQFFFNRFIIAQIHELGHGLDPIFNDNAWRFSIFKPEDYFSYMGEYVKLLEDWNSSVGKMDGQEIDMFFIDPLSIRDGFGIDELATSSDRGQFYTEMEMVREVCLYIEHSNIDHAKDGERYREIIKEIGLDNLFTKGDSEMLKSWQFWLGKENERTIFQEEIANQIPSFGIISSEHIQDFEDMAQKHFEKYVRGDVLVNTEWDEIVIKMKSTYILAAYRFLSELVKRGEIKNDGASTLYSIYQGFSDMIYWQACHAATGPFGEYLNLAYGEADIRRQPEDQLAPIMTIADRERTNSNISSSQRLISCFENLYKNIVKIQAKRTVLWGAKDNSIYPQMAKEIFNEAFGIDPYGYGKG